MPKREQPRRQPWHARWEPWQVVAAAFAAGAVTARVPGVLLLAALLR